MPLSYLLILRKFKVLVCMCLYFCEYHTVQHREIKSTTCNTQALYVPKTKYVDFFFISNNIRAFTYLKF